jgi:hypothetical protein
VHGCDCGYCGREESGEDAQEGCEGDDEKDSDEDGPRESVWPGNDDQEGFDEDDEGPADDDQKSEENNSVA